MKRLIPYSLFVGLLLVLGLPLLGQDTGVTAEALGQANLRATTDIQAELVGQITSGTRYPVIGRSEFYPWLLLADPATRAPLGWVFAELVTTQGDLNSVPFSDMIVSETSNLISPTPAETAEPAQTTPDSLSG